MRICKDKNIGIGIIHLLLVSSKNTVEKVAVAVRKTIEAKVSSWELGHKIIIILEWMMHSTRSELVRRCGLVVLYGGFCEFVYKFDSFVI